MNRKREIENLVSSLSQLEKLKDFEYKKSKSLFSHESNAVRKRIYLYPFIGIDSHDDLCLELRPVFGVRINVVSKYLSKFYEGTKRAYLDKDTELGFPHTNVVENEFKLYDETYSFSVNDNFERKKSFDGFIELINNKALPFLNNYSDVNYLFENVTVRMLEGDVKNWGAGIWIFEHLLLTRIVNESRYAEFESFLENYQKNLFEEGEPNALIYYPKFEAVNSYIKSIGIP